MTNRSVATALSIVELLSRRNTQGLSAIARELNLSKATALRTLQTLSEFGWVFQDAPPDSAWRLSPHFSSLSRGTTSELSLREVAADGLRKLNEETEETVHLAAAQPDHLILIERLDSTLPLRAFIPLGSVLPFHASATGLAYLSALTDREIEQKLQSPLEKRTAHTVTEQSVIITEVQKIRERGYSLNDQSLSDGISSVGAPLTDHHERPIGAISISGPSSRITAERRVEVGPRVVRAARQISQQLHG